MPRPELETLRQELASGSAQLLDIREWDEWKAGHLAQAVFCPLSGINGGDIPTELDLSKKTYIHCRSGRRVLQGKPLLEEAGFTQVIALPEGFDALAAAGFTTEN